MKTFKQFLDKPLKSDAEIAKEKHVSTKTVKRAIKTGSKIEKEHTNRSDVAKHIARAHVGERPDYYAKLKRHVE